MDCHCFRRLGLAALLALALSAPASADIVGTTGDVLFIGGNGPAFSAVPDGPGEHNDFIFAWNELQDVMLGAPLMPDLGPLLGAGSMIDVHMLRFDPETAGEAVGTVTFRNRILGVMITRDGLDATDFLGSPGTTYPAHPSAMLRGLEERDFLGTMGPYTLVMRWGASSPGDQMRVITQAVPEPGSLALLLGLGAAGLVLLRRNR